jgi:hypothetical protein
LKLIGEDQGVDQGAEIEGMAVAGMTIKIEGDQGAGQAQVVEMTVIREEDLDQDRILEESDPTAGALKETTGAGTGEVKKESIAESKKAEAKLPGKM